MENEKDYIVFSQKCAGWLMYQGAKLLRVVPDRNKPNMFVYYFPNTDYVKDRVKQYLSMNK